MNRVSYNCTFPWRQSKGSEILERHFQKVYKCFLEASVKWLVIFLLCDLHEVLKINALWAGRVCLSMSLLLNNLIIVD